MRLEGRVAIITGAGRGIGQTIALAYAREGARLALAARKVGELEDTARQVESLGVPAYIIPTDVTDQEQVDRMVAQTVERYSSVDILVNNAGICGPVGVLQDNDPCLLDPERASESDWDLSLLPGGTSDSARAKSGPDHQRLGAGAMSAWPHMSSYCASKAAVARLSEGLAMELAQTNVHVNSLNPGSIHTGMWEEMRDAAAVAGIREIHELGLKVTSGGGHSIEDVADLAVFLASADSGNLSGRLISSVLDDFSKLPERIPEIMGSQAYQLRRVELP